MEDLDSACVDVATRRCLPGATTFSGAARTLLWAGEHSMSDGADPRVTVLMPVHNGAEYLRAAVESILGQTLADFEFVIVNDGSTDGAGELLGEYARGDRRVVLIEQENRGCTQALIRGLSIARGRYVARMDGDDVSEPERLRVQWEYMEAHPECAAVGCAMRCIDGQGRVTREIVPPGDHAAIEEDLLKGFGRVVPHPGVMFRREALEAAGGYRERFRTAQDLDVYLRLALHGRLANVPEFLLQYRRHDEAVGVKRIEEQFRDVTAILREAYRARGRRMPHAALSHWRGLVASELGRRARGALSAGELLEAAGHAARAVRLAPGRWDHWKALLRVVKGTVLKPRSGGPAVARVAD